jgi:hypothetical protein
MESYTKPSSFQSNTDRLDYRLPLQAIEKEIFNAHQPGSLSEYNDYLAEIDKARTRWACISSKTQRSKAGGYKDRLEIQSFRNVTDFKFSYPAIQNTKPPSRQGKTINKFSQKSRSNLIKKTKKIDREKEGLPFFLTLTYHSNFQDCEQAKNHLNTFLQRFRRIGETKYIWKMEFQKRGAIHFHLLLIPGQEIWPEQWKNLDRIKKIELLRMKVSSFWNVITGESIQNLKAGTNVRIVNNWRMATGYIAKYMGKSEKPVTDKNGQLVETGRFWGMSYNWNLKPVLSCSIDAKKMDIVKEVLKKASFISFHEFLKYARNRLNELKRWKNQERAEGARIKIKNQVKFYKRKFVVDMEKINQGKFVSVDIEWKKMNQILNEFDLNLNPFNLNANQYAKIN